MPRRILFVVALVATLLAACGGTASAPALTDPKDILAHAATSLEGVKTVHFKASLTGKIDSGALTGGVGLPLDVTGSTLEGDIDVVDKEAKVALAAPAVFGFTADVISTGGQTYIKTSLKPDGKYRKLDLGALTGGLSLPLPSLPTTVGSPDPSAVAAMVDKFKAQLDKLTIPPTKLADEKIGDQDCYHVQTKVSTADLPQASSALGTGSVTVDVWTRKSDYRPARLTIAVDAGTSGNVAITVDLTNYDAPVTVTAPPADQISDEPFTIQSLMP